MGITSSDINLIEMALGKDQNVKTVCELGSQNLYMHDTDPIKPPFASEWYLKKGIDYYCIDMAGDNGAIHWDLSIPIVKFSGIQYDMITDFGTSEHVVHNVPMTKTSFHEGHIHSVYPSHTPDEHEIKVGFYNCWKNKHDLMKHGGVMISVNPKTGNWPGHGYTYITKKFYERLANLMQYRIIWLNENPAMGNPNAVNIECILVKTNDWPFTSYEDFQTCEQFLS